MLRISQPQASDSSNNKVKSLATVYDIIQNGEWMMGRGETLYILYHPFLRIILYKPDETSTNYHRPI